MTQVTPAHIALSAFVVLWIGLAGCAPDISETDFYSRHPEDSDPTEDIVTLGEETINGVLLRVLAEEQLHVGPNTILVAASRDGTPLTSGRVNTAALWLHEGGELAPPFGQTSGSSANDENRFELLIHLLEPVEDEGQWVLDISFDLNGASGQTRLEVSVQPDIWVQYVPESDGAESYYVSWIEPIRPETGEAPFEVAFHSLRADEFVPVTNAVLDLYPFMDMGGGEGHSTPYETPIHAGSGLYRGSVNFIMAGGWDLTVHVDRQGRKDTVVFKGITVY